MAEFARDIAFDAEQQISERQRLRSGATVEERKVVALEIIADELTRIRAELTMLRSGAISDVSRSL